MPDGTDDVDAVGDDGDDDDEDESHGAERTAGVIYPGLDGRPESG